MSNKNTFYFSIISDIHVLAKELMIDSKDFETFTKFDRKLLIESEALFKKSLDLASENESSYIFLTGDLTKDGEIISHKLVADTLKTWKGEDKNRKIFILPGNHDINNSKSFDYRKNSKTDNISPNDFLEIYDFCYEDLSKLEMYKDSENFISYLDTVNKKYKRDNEASYYAHGFLSYMARIKQEDKQNNGITIIALDTSIYSCDFESSHQDFKENVPGFLEENQMIWACNKIEEAKKRKDLVIILGHHAIIPNFRNQELVFGPFIIKNWAVKFNSVDPRVNNKTPIEVLADMGIKFIFTGHLHENGTAKFKSQAGNEIFNIQTGSPVTYPLPIRHIEVVDDVKDFSGFSLNIKTQLINEFTFENLKGEKEEVKNATLYTLEKQLSLKDVIFNYVKTQANKPEIYNMDIKNEVLKKASAYLNMNLPENGYIKELFPLILKFFPITVKKYIHISIIPYKKDFALLINFINSSALITSSAIEDAFENIIKQVENKILLKNYIIETYEFLAKKILSMPLDENSEETIYDFANYIYQYKALDESNRPTYIENFINKLNDPTYDLIDEVLYFARDEINQVYNQILESVVFKKNESNKKFFNNLIINKGLLSNLVKYGLIIKLDNLKDLMDLLAKPIFGKKHLEGVDVASYILHNRKLRNARNSYSAKMFGTESLRKYTIDLIMSMSNEVTKYYQNEDLNELEHYFNYIEYDEYENQ